MAIEYIGVRLIRPVLVTATAVAIVAGLIILIGETLLNVHDTSVTSELKRVELWVGVGLTVGILAVATFLATRPAGALGPIDKEVAIGSKPMRGELSTVVTDPRLRHGEPGTRADLAAGFTLYARNGALATLIEVMTGVEDIGDVQRTLLFARGLHGAPDELWIPIEAVSSVYPETRTAYLAIAGDETEALGWNKPPLSFMRTARPKETPLY